MVEPRYFLSLVIKAIRGQATQNNFWVFPDAFPRPIGSGGTWSAFQVIAGHRSTKYFDTV